jgi:hypothetical protein
MSFIMAENQEELVSPHKHQLITYSSVTPIRNCALTLKACECFHPCNCS